MHVYKKVSRRFFTIPYNSYHKMLWTFILKIKALVKFETFLK
jgi:hypothetical protein